MREVLDAFHPLIGGWFRERFGSPTEPQLAGWPRIHAGEDVLIAAPTGSGKTLAAFLACLDDLVVRGLQRPLEGTQILYVSPLKALSNDVHRNLEAPLAELAAHAAARGERFPEIRVATRTGDTPMAERAKLAKHPPHILVTTPESLFILLTSKSGRASLAGLRTVIVDEIHAIAGDKRGAHLALSLERLDRLVEQSGSRRPVRVGLSATQRPIERIARLLVGTRRPLPYVADAGHRRALDLAIEITDDELGAVASNEQFGRVYDRIAELVTQHRSTIVFVNTRRLVERAAAALEQRLGEEHVVAHHGSMSRALRLAAEQKLKYGQVKCAVATASLELGIDVGAVDLVVQLGSPRSIATLLQRVGRSNHTNGGMPKGRMFALTRDQLVECASLVRGVKRGNLDEIGLRDAPLDILAQQIVAIAAAEDIPESELGALIRGATPYAALDETKLEQVLQMVSEGVSDRRGRNGAHIHRDRIGGMLKGRRGARLAAITSGGAIPDMATYDVVQWPEEIRVGTLDEDFAIESSAGDIFQLGNTAWKIRRVEAGRVLVEDAHGQPPTIPFWVGEGPARTRELSDEVSDLRREIDTRLDTDDIDAVGAWLASECGMESRAAMQLVAYLVAGRTALGALPRNDLLIAERFFDEAGGMQLVIHAPLGGRINRAWGLALRKKFCRTFDFELQAAATDDGIVISLGQPHSFALETVFGFVPAKQAQDTLIQALLDRPMFEIRWRWNVTRSLVVLRRRNGKKIPPHLIKMRSADTLSVVFPQAQACPENLPGSLPGMPGDRDIPDHPLVFETIRDCLVEAMDISGFQELVGRLEAGEIRVVARDTVEPSPLSHELLNANPYAYLDDAPLEERRTRAVQVRRGLPNPGNAANDDHIGALDEDAIRAATEEVAPTVRDIDELHDALLGLWLVPEEMGIRLAPAAADWFEALAGSGRACRLTWTCEGIDCAAWVATEKLGVARAILGEQVECTPAIATPTWAKKFDDRESAITRLIGAHLDHRGPISTRALAAELGLRISDVVDAVLALEGDGGILRGRFTKGSSGASTTARQALDAASDTATLHDLEWCNRRVLARIHRMTLARLRKEIEPVSAAALQRFLLRWQRVAKNRQLIGADGLARIVEQLQGFETASGAWEREILPARLCGYDASWLDQMCLAGQVVWCRLSPRKPNVPEEIVDDSVANDERADEPAAAGGGGRGKARRERRLDKRLVAPLRDLFGDRYDLAEAGAEAARRSGASREEIAAAAQKALGESVPIRAAEVITSLVTATAMLKNELDDEEADADATSRPPEHVRTSATDAAADAPLPQADTHRSDVRTFARTSAGESVADAAGGDPLPQADTHRSDVRTFVRTSVGESVADAAGGDPLPQADTHRSDVRTFVRTSASESVADAMGGDPLPQADTHRSDVRTFVRTSAGESVADAAGGDPLPQADTHRSDARTFVRTSPSVADAMGGDPLPQADTHRSDARTDVRTSPSVVDAPLPQADTHRSDVRTFVRTSAGESVADAAGGDPSPQADTHRSDVRTFVRTSAGESVDAAGDRGAAPDTDANRAGNVRTDVRMSGVGALSGSTRWNAAQSAVARRAEARRQSDSKGPAAMGPAGSTGSMGTKGWAESADSTGSMGTKGWAESADSTGSMGTKGPTGSMGSTGSMGTKGPMGSTGSMGSVATGPASAGSAGPERSAIVRRGESAAARTTARKTASTTRSAPSRSAPLALMLRRDVAWLRAAAVIDSSETAPIGETAGRIRDHLARVGASFLPDLVGSIDLPPDEIEDALWELVGAGLATADGFASLRVLVDRKRGEVKSLFDVAKGTQPGLAKGSGPNVAPQLAAKPVRSWQDAIRKVRTHDRTRPGHALRSLPTAAGRWSLLPPTSPEAIDAEASARQLLLRYGVVFRDLVTRESCLPPWRDLLVALRRLEARGEIRGGRFINGFVGEQFAMPEALDELRAVRHAGAVAEVSRISATDPLNLVGILSPGPRVPAVVGNAVLYVDGQAVASLEAGELVRRAPIPEGARIDDDLTYHPPPRRDTSDAPSQAALPL